MIDFAKEKSIRVLDLVRPRLTNRNFSDLVLKKDPMLIFFNAHGNEATIYGDKIGKSEEVLIEEDKNHRLLSGRIVYARACRAAASLGKACTEKGGCFIGYKTPFSFWIDEEQMSKPLNDNVARLFLEPSNAIVTSLLKGNTTQEAFDKSLNVSNKNILKLLKREEEPGTTQSIALLWSNMQGQEILGEKDMKLI